MRLVERLAAAGCIAAAEEAAMLFEAAAGDHHRLESLVRRREAGEPVEWIVGWAPFCGLRIVMRTGVYVPRVQTEVLVRAATARLPADGVAVDLATGSGAIAVALHSVRPGAEVVTTEVDPVAAACARDNGLVVYEGDLDAGLPASFEGRVDVLTANVPYVPTAAIALLSRDTQDHEPRMALDGGVDGLDLVRRVLAAAPRWLRPVTGRVFVEIGPDQAGSLGHLVHHTDAEGDVRAAEGP